jgi:hypothetical protein
LETVYRVEAVTERIQYRVERQYRVGTVYRLETVTVWIHSRA